MGAVVMSAKRKHGGDSMKVSSMQKINELLGRYPALAVCEADLKKAVETLIATYNAGGKLLICGNGGSAADAEHIVGELMKGFILPRRIPERFHVKLQEICPETADYLSTNLQGALPAISLVSQTALNTAFANDQAPDLCFAQQVYGLGEAVDTLLGISTSGNSANVVYALQIAKAKGMRTIALTGESGGRLKGLADICICVPSKVTFKIQEYHLPIYHALCIAVENEFFN